MRTITFENGYSPRELAQELVDAGCSPRSSLADIIAGKDEGVDEDVTLDCVVDEDEVLDQLGDESILDAAANLKSDGVHDREIEDAILYTRAGDLPLAIAMFTRIFEGADLRSVERALS